MVVLLQEEEDGLQEMPESMHVCCFTVADLVIYHRERKIKCSVSISEVMKRFHSHHLKSLLTFTFFFH